jgi:hypothetical protein
MLAGTLIAIAESSSSYEVIRVLTPYSFGACIGAIGWAEHSETPHFNTPSPPAMVEHNVTLPL